MRLIRQWSTLTLLVALTSCGGENGSASVKDNPTGGSGATGARGRGRDQRCGGGIITGGSGGTGTGTGGTGTGGSLGADAKVCGGIEAAVETQPFNMLILFDQSISMADFLDNVAPPTRWEAVTSAMISFFQSPEAKLLSIGLAYFEQIDPTTFGTSCREQDYATPEVGDRADERSGAGAELVDSIKSHKPTGFTPTAPALKMALAHAKAYTMAHPGKETMVALATDGIPTQCDASADDGDRAGHLRPRRSKAYPRCAPSSWVLPAMSLGSLKEISMAGGTGQPVFVTDPTTTTDQIKTAFSRLTRTSLACSYRIPLGGEGGRTDPSMINVDIRRPGKPIAGFRSFRAQRGAATAGTTTIPMKPENIMLCPTTCQNLFNGEIRIVVGCAAPPPM